MIKFHLLPRMRRFYRTNKIEKTFGPLTVDIEFYYYVIDDKKIWNMGWDINPTNLRNTGLFKHIDEWIKQEVEKFISQEQPDVFLIYGRDVKRNAFGRQRYKQYKAENYTLFEIHNEDSHRATDGVVGTAWMKQKISQDALMFRGDELKEIN